MAWMQTMGLARSFPRVLLFAFLTAPALGHAVQSCEIAGQSVSPNNGNTTAGKTGLKRCREGGPVLREETVIEPAVGRDRRFSAEGVNRLERVWVTQFTGTRSTRITTLEQEFHESGTLVHERRWLPTECGSELQLEQHLYLNGQRRETRFHDNGRVSLEGVSLVKGRYDTQAIGVQKAFDDQGRLRIERFHDARGRVNRELDDTGRVLRDEALFEDGSRKAFAR
jgi:hypothetical protein